MKKIRLWTVDDVDGSGEQALEIDPVSSTETEQRLEELVAKSPDLLLENGSLIGRQVPTEGGTIDLLGVDQDGLIVIFELKRGTLTRDAVAQILDYGSDVAAMSATKLARLAEQNSGRSGIERIDDFEDWYAREFPDADLLSDPPRMVLVGLGVDERARRMVNFLAENGIQIKLLTFQAFRVGGKLVLARQSESQDPAKKTGGETATKETNLRVLHESAEKRGIIRLLEEVGDFVDARVPGYRWPGKTAYSFSLQERTSSGKPTLRSYVTLYLHPRKQGALLLTFPPRAREAVGNDFDLFVERFDEARWSSIVSSTIATEVEITPENWPGLQDDLEGLLDKMVAGWRDKMAELDTEEAPSS